MRKFISLKAIGLFDSIDGSAMIQNETVFYPGTVLRSDQNPTVKYPLFMSESAASR